MATKFKPDFSSKTTQAPLLRWYHQNRRDLPWRRSKDPYRIWISEVMLQQTTAKAVIPFYERFLNEFPDLITLANAKEPQVLAAWAGLGYYSRAKNLHKAAKLLASMDRFPQQANALEKLPGFGPYTSRAVASIAFGDPVGVLDGNVIRVLSRFCNLDVPWWQPQGRAKLQTLADIFVHGVPAGEMNQALMELGSQICTPTNPTCLVCPLFANCGARQQQRQQKLPRKKPRRPSEIWLLELSVLTKKGAVLLVKNDYAPFLRGHPFFPGQAHRLKSKPKTFDFRHSITHHDIFVNVSRETQARANAKLKNRNYTEAKWVYVNELKSVLPASLATKALAAVNIFHDERRDRVDARHHARLSNTKTKAPRKRGADRKA